MHKRSVTLKSIGKKSRINTSKLRLDTLSSNYQSETKKTSPEAKKFDKRRMSTNPHLIAFGLCKDSCVENCEEHKNEVKNKNIKDKVN